AVLTTQAHKGTIRHIEFSRDGSLFLTTSDDSTFKVWEAQNGLLRLQGVAGAELAITSPAAAFMPTNDRILAGQYYKQGTGRIWDTSGAVVGTLPEKWLGAVSISFSADGKRFVTASAFGGTAHVVDAATGTQVFELVGHNGAVYDALYSG